MASFDTRRSSLNRLCSSTVDMCRLHAKVRQCRQPRPQVTCLHGRLISMQMYQHTEDVYKRSVINIEMERLESCGIVGCSHDVVARRQWNMHFHCATGSTTPILACRHDTILSLLFRRMVKGFDLIPSEASLGTQSNECQKLIDIPFFSMILRMVSQTRSCITSGSKVGHIGHCSHESQSGRLFKSSRLP